MLSSASSDGEGDSNSQKTIVTDGAGGQDASAEQPSDMIAAEQEVVTGGADGQDATNEQVNNSEIVRQRNTADTYKHNETTTGVSEEHNYAKSELVRSTARCHKRTGKPLTRKRNRNESEWKCNLRKRLRQSGASYLTARSGKTVPAKTVKVCKRDHESCRYKCAIIFSADDQENINQQHWLLSDNEKRQFYLNTTSDKHKKRTRRAANVNRKKESYSYTFIKGIAKVRVCKEFNLLTLNIDAKRIVNTHKTKNQTTGTAAPYRRGQHVKKSGAHFLSAIRMHIESIPRIESHYCRRSTNKEYISGNFNLQILYEKYCENCVEKGIPIAKKHLYRQVFCKEYNITFQKPKKDRCDLCESVKFSNLTLEDETKWAAHMQGKVDTQQERQRDRESNSCVVRFDMQNVFSLPQANVYHKLTTEQSAEELLKDARKLRNSPDALANNCVLQSRSVATATTTRLRGKMS